ncbi:MAG: exo-alpha-sialidase [Lysobacteraceae bacterium]|nr:MAG: exo-alpha-sialidase [Xanthomonadaceae bacterium]
MAALAFGAAALQVLPVGQARLERSAAPDALGPPEAVESAPVLRTVEPKGPAPARASVLSAMRYTIGPTRRVDARLAGAQLWEPSLVVTHAGSDSAQDDQIAAIWMEGRRSGEMTDTRIGSASSFDGADAWTTTELVAPAGSTGTQFDPMTAVDATTGRTYVGAMSRDAAVGASDTVWLAYKDASAAQPGGPRAIFVQSGVDKGWMAAGTPPAPLNGSVLYVLFKAAALGSLGLRSLDEGATFEPFAIPDGVGHQPRIGPGGVLTISFSGSVGSARASTLVRSVDALESISQPLIQVPMAATRRQLDDAVPGGFRIPDLAMHAVDPVSGRLYLLYNDVTGTSGGEADVNLLLRDSIDGGANWSEPRIVNGDASPAGDQFMPWIECDAQGRLHLAYFDNRRNVAPDAGDIALLDVYYALSTDGGSTWEEARLTGAPLHAQSTWWNPLGYGTQFVGDYLGMAVSRHAVYVAYPGDDAGEVGMMVTRIDFAGIPSSPHRTRAIPTDTIGSRIRRPAPFR